MIILAAWIFADFLSGLVHWWEDRALTGKSQFAFINGVRDDNEIHHKQPAHFLAITWWQNIETSAPIAWIISLFFFSDRWFDGSFLGWTFLFLSFANLIHRWAHEPLGKRPAIVRLAQRIGLFVSPRQHGEHHFENGKVLSRKESYRRYCVMTSWLNPILDRISFFDFLNFISRRS